MSENNYIFISYSRNDADIANYIAKSLGNAGFTVWIDVAELSPGTEWSKEINKAIKSAQILVYLVSRNSLESAWTELEVGVMISRGSQVVPVILDDFAAENIPISLSRFQWVDFRDNHKNGITALLKSIPKSYRSDTTVSKKANKSKGYVFLSYSKADDDFLVELRVFLRDNGYGYWDFSESDRDYHSQFHLELENVIQDAHATLTILSKHWKQSIWAIKEYLYSEEISTPVFLLKAKEMPPTLVVSGIPYIDFTISKTRGFAELKKELNRKGL